MFANFTADTRRQLLRHRARRERRLGAGHPDSITGGQARSAGGIGGFPPRTSTILVTVLQFGSLPFQIQELGLQTVSPTLGQNFLQQTLLAGIIGIVLVIVFMLVYYRLPGVVACVALIFYTLIVSRSSASSR